MKASFLFVILFAVCGLSLAVGQDAVLRAGDQIDIRLGGVPGADAGQVSGSYQLDGQGDINLPHIGKIRAEGQTQNSLQSAIEQAYRTQQIFTNPTITINMAAGARLVNVGGDVKGPRRVEFTPDLTLLSAITACGGFTDYADQKKVRLLRDGKVTLHDVRKIREDPTLDVRLKPGDSIEVPQSFW
jgi:polysaccharide export outer membrane protein